MKKIITLLFFVGFLTSAFAQSNRHGQYNNQNNDNRNQSSKNYQWDDNRGHDHEYAYNNDRHDWDKHDVRRDHDQYRDYGNHERRQEFSFAPKKRGSLFVIIFGKHKRN